MSYLAPRPDPCQSGADALARAKKGRQWRAKMYARPKPEIKSVDSVNSKPTEPEPKRNLVIASRSDLACVREFYEAVRSLHPFVIEFAVRNPQEIAKIISGILDDLSSAIHTPAQIVTIKKIVNAVARAFGLSPEEILSARRHKSLMAPRFVCYALCRRLTLRSLPEIGRLLGHRDHTTILHGARKVEPLIKAIEFTIGAEVVSVTRWAELARELYPVVMGKAS